MFTIKQFNNIFVFSLSLALFLSCILELGCPLTLDWSRVCLPQVPTWIRDTVRFLFLNLGMKCKFDRKGQNLKLILLYYIFYFYVFTMNKLNLVPWKLLFSCLLLLVGSWRRWQLPLQPGDSVFEFAVSSFMICKQSGITCLQDVQRAHHLLHLLLNLFGVRALRCQLQDKIGYDFEFNRSDFFSVWDHVTVPPSPTVRPSSESAFLSPPAEP